MQLLKGPALTTRSSSSLLRKSTMAPTSGFDPSNPSTRQSFELARFVEHNNISELRPGEGVASGEDTAGTSKPRMPMPKAMILYTKGDWGAY